MHHKIAFAETQRSSCFVYSLFLVYLNGQNGKLTFRCFRRRSNRCMFYQLLRSGVKPWSQIAGSIGLQTWGAIWDAYPDLKVLAGEDQVIIVAVALNTLWTKPYGNPRHCVMVQSYNFSANATSALTGRNSFGFTHLGIWLAHWFIGMWLVQF